MFFRRIMVPLDGSAFGEQALPAALELARRCNARLELVRVHTPAPPQSGRASRFSVDHLLGRDIRRYGSGWAAEVERMRELTDHLRATESVEIYSQVVQGDAIAPELVRRARNTFADVVVMTTHGAGSGRPAGLGAVAFHLVRSLEMPVLLLRPGLDASSVPSSFQHVLVPLDGSQRSEDALTASQRIARPFGSSATLLRVVENNTRPLGSADPDAQRATRLAEAEAYLNQVAVRIAPEWLQPAVAVRAQDSVAAAILDTAGSVGADLIAMATHGRTGVARLVMGSIAEQVLRTSALPMLLFGPAAARRRSVLAASNTVASSPAQA